MDVKKKKKIKLILIIVLSTVLAIVICVMILTRSDKYKFKSNEGLQDYYNEQNSGLIEKNNKELAEFDAEEFEKLLKSIDDDPDYNPDEKYTDSCYYYLMVRASEYPSSRYDDDYEENGLKEVTYIRYVYEDDNWVLAENKNNSPFFNQTGNGIITNPDFYKIPIYELEEGKNKVVVTEITNSGAEKEKEFIINRTLSQNDKMYEIKEVNKTEKLSLDTYQDEVNININDSDNVLLTGSFYSDYDIKEITWKRYDYNKSKGIWEESYNAYPKKEYEKTKIIDNYWAIDVMNAKTDGTKIEITAIDSSGDEVTKTVLINDSSNSKKYDYNNTNYYHGITNDNGIEFTENVVLIIFNSNVKETRCEEIINQIGGKVEKCLSEVNIYSIEFDFKFPSTSSIRKCCSMIEEKYKEISNVSPDYIMRPNDVTQIEDY